MVYKVDILMNYNGRLKMIKEKDCLLWETKEVDNHSFIYSFQLDIMSDYQGFVTDQKLKKTNKKTIHRNLWRAYELDKFQDIINKESLIMNVDIKTIHPIICKECPFLEVEQEKIYYDNKRANYIKCKNINICRYVFESTKNAMGL